MEELTRGNSVDFIHPEDRSQAVDRLLMQLGEDDRPQVFSARVLAADGSTRWVLASVVRIVWEDRPAALCFFTDISEIKRMEREREGLEARLIQAHKMEALGTLASGIAHDFNNILGAILGFSEMSLLSAPEGSMLRRNLGRVIDAAQRATDLVRQILTFSRQSEQEKKPVLLGTIAKETLRMLRATLPATIEVQPRLETEAPVLADPTQMHQVILNLCTNAGQAMRAHGGRLDLKLTEVTLGADSQAIPPDLTPGPYVLLSVSDTGNGIAPEILPRIFDPFFTTKDKGEGTGMGLAVVHGIVRGHQGTVLVDSLPGQGSTFNVYLPRLEPLAAGKDETGPGKTLVGRRERILFVDDEEPLVELATQVLTRLGYEVVGRTSSPAALDLFRENPDRFDLVITDYTMPRMTGADLAREILALRPSLPVILCTGYSEDMTPDLAADIGVRTYLNKPVPLAELSQAIRRILEDRP
jgi:signal transduction histidine kinase/CheY-like chemotaxis protein